MVENDDLKINSQMSQLMVESGIDSVPQIAKNIDGQTTLRTYC